MKSIDTCIELIKWLKKACKLVFKIFKELCRGNWSWGFMMTFVFVSGIFSLLAIEYTLSTHTGSWIYLPHGKSLDTYTICDKAMNCKPHNLIWIQETVVFLRATQFCLLCAVLLFLDYLRCPDLLKMKYLSSLFIISVIAILVSIHEFYNDVAAFSKKFFKVGSSFNFMIGLSVILTVAWVNTIAIIVTMPKPDKKELDMQSIVQEKFNSEAEANDSSVESGQEGELNEEHQTEEEANKKLSVWRPKVKRKKRKVKPSVQIPKKRR